MKQRTIKIDKLVCTDDSNKPNDIAQKNWIKKGEHYTPINLFYNPIFKTQAFKLAEVDPQNPQYHGYNVNRFGLTDEALAELANVEEMEEVI